MATFSFTETLPQFKALISSSQLRTIFNELKDHWNVTFNPAGLTLPSADGTSGQVLQADGDTTTSWVTLSANSAWENKTTGFNTANNGRYVINTGVTATLHAPADGNELWIRPKIGQDLATTQSTLARNAAENIAGAAANFDLDDNVVFHVFSDGTDWDVAIYPLIR